MTQVAVALPNGEALVPIAIEHPAGAPWAAVAIAHGAGAGMDHAFLVSFAAALRREGLATVRFDFPYRAAGRRMPGPASHAIATWAAVAERVETDVPGVPFVAAGKSYGGRMASMAAGDGVIAPTALVYLGYPFHPPGKPEAERGAHLARVTAPQLFVEGTVDPFVQPVDAFERAVATSPDAEIHWIPGGGHSFEVKGAKRAPGEIGDALAAPVADWLRGRLSA